MWSKPTRPQRSYSLASPGETVRHALKVRERLGVAANSGIPNNDQSSILLGRDLRMPYLPRGVAQPAELVKHLNALGPFPPGVVNLRYTLDDDWSGDPAIFFWITLSDEAARTPALSETAKRIKSFITQQLDPVGQWGLIPYFNFRSRSEQEKLKEEVFG
jgi:hypothetical protein